MKVRAGFVSNSSSSSFCLVGVEHSKIVAEIVKLEGIDYDTMDYDDREEILRDMEQGHGEYFGKDFIFVANYGDEPFAAGVPVGILELMTLPQARTHVANMLRERGVTVDPRDISIVYGECGGG